MNEKGFSVQCDWLTLATFDFAKYCLAVADIRRIAIGEDWKEGRWLQYTGFTNGKDIFYGMAVQSGGREHFILKISGSTAGSLLDEILSKEWSSYFYATRIDVQRTRTPPKWWIPRDVYDDLKKRKGTCSMIESETGSTVYIGNRSSGRFCRLYEKQIGEGMLRCEIELKGQHSRMAWGFLLKGKSVADIYAAHLEKLPLQPNEKESFMPNHENDLDLRLEELKISNERALKWLRTLLPKMQQMAASHDIGEQVRGIFYSLSQERGLSEHEQ